MSSSLLRKGLDLVCSPAWGLKRKSGKRNQKEALGSNKAGMKKQLRKLKRPGQPQNQRATAKGRVIKSAIEEYKKHASQNYLEQNLKYMLGSHSVTNKDVVKTILNQQSGRKAKDQQLEKKKKVQEKSVFSESDFKHFEKEYFASKQIMAN